MRKLTYFARASLDGRIAGPDGVLDWLFVRKDAVVSRFLDTVDTVIMGTATYDYMLAHGREAFPGMANYVLSRTVRQSEHPSVTLVPTDPTPFVEELKAREGKGIWLLGGGVIFRYLLQAGLVDEVSVVIHPLFLGRGVPLLAECDQVTTLELLDVERVEGDLVHVRYRVGGALDLDAD